MSYKWKVGDHARLGSAWANWLIADVSTDHIEKQRIRIAGVDYPLADCIPVIVRPKPLPKKIKRSELRAWFERQNGYMAPRWSRGSWTVRADGEIGSGTTLEAAILALRKALRKAGKFTP